MTIKRMDNVGIVVDDIKTATAFFVELGLQLEGEATVEGRWVDRVVGLDGVRSDIAMLRTPQRRPASGNTSSYNDVPYVGRLSA